MGSGELFQTGIQVVIEQQTRLMTQLNRLAAAIDNLTQAIAGMQFPTMPPAETEPSTPSVPVVTEYPFEPLSSYGASAQSPLTVDLDTGRYGGRAFVEVWVKSSGPAVFNIYGSANGRDYRLTQALTLTQAGEAHVGFNNAYQHLRVTTVAPNNNEIEIVASR